MLALEVTNLKKTFRKRRPVSNLLLKPWTAALQVEALCGIDLAVPFGSVFGVLGPNGAGKSTLIKIVTSLVRQTAGQVRVNGFDNLSEGARVRASVGIVPAEERSLYWRLTGRENLRFFSRLFDIPRRRARTRIHEVLELMELVSRADDPVHAYSSGMRQRLTIARALLHDPPILFLDEPTKSLDPHAAKRLRRFILDRLHREAGKTVFLATHNLGEAEELCDRVTILQEGRIVAAGTVAEIATGHLGRETYLLTVHAPDGLQGLELESQLLETGLYRVVLPVSRDEAGLDGRLRALMERGIRIIDCQRREHPLQEVFDRMQPGGNE